MIMKYLTYINEELISKDELKSGDTAFYYGQEPGCWEHTVRILGTTCSRDVLSIIFTSGPLFNKKYYCYTSNLSKNKRNFRTNPDLDPYGEENWEDE